MTGVYPIFAGSEEIGTAIITRDGLYYSIDCRCSLSGDILYKVLISGDGWNEDLGICVPMDGVFGIHTKISAKRLTGKRICFLAVPRHGAFTHDVFAVTEGSPFGYISKLENAFLIKKDSRYYITFSQQSGS